MSDKWEDITDDPLNSGPVNNITGDEPRQRDSEKWRMPVDDARRQHARVVKAVDDLRLLPSDMDLDPTLIGTDEDEWSNQDDPFQYGWTLDTDTALRVYVDKVMQFSDSNTQVQRSFIERTQVASFNVYVPRFGFNDAPQMQRVADWCAEFGIKSMVWMRLSLVTTSAAEFDDKRLRWTSAVGPETQIYSPNSVELWAELTTRLSTFATISAAQPALMGVFFDVENYYLGQKGQLYPISWDAESVARHAADSGGLDFIRSVITVRRSYNGPTKSGKARTIPLSKTLELQLMKTYNYLKALQTDNVFKNVDVNKKLKKMCKRADVPSFGFHKFRHTFATWAIESKKASLKSISEVLGHAHVSTTLDTYYHLLQERMDMDFLDEPTTDK